MLICKECGKDKSSNYGELCRKCVANNHSSKIKTHGDSQNNKLYYLWRNMKSRCNNVNNPKYKRYGGRGIFVCSEWENYGTFKQWALSSGYKYPKDNRGDSMSIDRIDVNGNYEPLNCQFIKHRINSSKDQIFFTKTDGLAIKTLKEYFNFTNSKLGDLFGCKSTLISKVINNKATLKG